MKTIITQTLAMALDAYRELNSKRLFWITLVLSGLVVACFAGIGINDRGLSLLWWDIEVPINTSMMSESDFYKLLFSTMGIGVWLTWIATALALISTATIFPDLIAGGSIDVMLSKPISRLRLFVTKYVFGLTFVALQVAVFSAASFFVIGFRGGAWEPALFLAIPVVLVFFSYLFAISVLVGVITRSTIAALLVTALVWFGIFLVHSTENTLLTMRISKEIVAERAQLAVERLPADAPAARRAEREESLAALEASRQTWTRWHQVAFGAKTLLPKTTETVNLLSRMLVDLAKLPSPTPPDDAAESPFGDPRTTFEAAQRAEDEINARSPWWVVGTSLLSELVLVALAAWIFCRRDY